jgi:hypothetical protein
VVEIKKYRILFHGLNGDEEIFKIRMQAFGISPENVDLMIQKAPVVLKADITLKVASQYAKVIQQAGGVIKIQEYACADQFEKPDDPFRVSSFQDFTMCPVCGFKQKKREACAKCGTKFSRK